MQVAPLAFGPQEVAALQRFAAPERKCRFERGGVVVVVRGGEQLVEVVEVDADVCAVELVALAVVKPRLAERALGLADGLPQSRACALGVLSRLDGLGQLVAARALGVEREVDKQLVTSGALDLVREPIDSERAEHRDRD